jgi:hypothetical protein
MYEKDLNKKIRTALHDPPDTVCWRNHGGVHSVRGLPDIVGCHKGIFFAIEVKLPGKEKTLTKLQAKKLRDLKAAGAVTMVATTVVQARDVIGECSLRAKFQSVWQESTKIDPDTGCWEWTGSRMKKGYGLIRHYFNGKTRVVLAHRVMAALYLGFSPDNETRVLHHCDNPPCINPSHLWLGTQGDNMEDAAKKNRASGSRLSLDDVRMIRKLGRRGVTHQKIAKQFGISRRYAGRICSGQKRKYVT